MKQRTRKQRRKVKQSPQTAVGKKTAQDFDNVCVSAVEIATYRIHHLMMMCLQDLQQSLPLEPAAQSLTDSRLHIFLPDRHNLLCHTACCFSFNRLWKILSSGLEYLRFIEIREKNSILQGHCNRHETMRPNFYRDFCSFWHPLSYCAYCCFNPSALYWVEGCDFSHVLSHVVQDWSFGKRRNGINKQATLLI